LTTPAADTAAFFNSLDPVKARAISAGTQPAEHVHTEVVEVMVDVARIRDDVRTRVARLISREGWGRAEE
jgi:hypothetical protein